MAICVAQSACVRRVVAIKLWYQGLGLIRFRVLPNETLYDPLFWTFLSPECNQAIECYVCKISVIDTP